MDQLQQDWFDEPESQCNQCQDCVFPDGCIREYAIQKTLSEDVASIRGEE